MSSTVILISNVSVVVIAFYHFVYFLNLPFMIASLHKHPPYTHLHPPTYTHTHTHTHIHTYIHIHTHIHTYIQWRRKKASKYILKYIHLREIIWSTGNCDNLCWLNFKNRENVRFSVRSRKSAISRLHLMINFKPSCWKSFWNSFFNFLTVRAANISKTC